MKTTVFKLSPKQLYQIWKSEPEAVRLVDLRSTHDFASHHIPGAELIAAWNLNVVVNNSSPERLLVLVGGDDDRASQFARGRENVAVLEGGMAAWLLVGYPTAGSGLKDVLIQNHENHQKEKTMTNQNVIFHQLFEPETSTYTYLLADPKTREAVLIDPLLETVDRDLKLIQELDLKLTYILDTHVHADHVTGAGELRRRTGAKTALSVGAHVDCVDVPLEDGQELQVGSIKITVLATPGHTDSCMSYYVDGRVFTGDSLMIRGNGRTDFQQGSPQKLFESITKKLFKLPPETVLYPGHDYRGHTSSTIAMEMKHNPRIGGGKTLEQFTKIMSELKLANPKKIHEAVPSNLACGRKEDSRVFHPQIVDGIPEITPGDLNANLEKSKIIDVRQREEYRGELGHIPGATLVTLGPELETYLSKMDRAEEFVMVCRGGGRSAQATALAVQMGFKFVANLQGGMMRWNDLGYQVERN